MMMPIEQDLQGLQKISGMQCAGRWRLTCPDGTKYWRQPESFYLEAQNDK